MAAVAQKDRNREMEESHTINEATLTFQGGPSKAKEHCVLALLKQYKIKPHTKRYS